MTRKTSSAGWLPVIALAVCCLGPFAIPYLVRYFTSEPGMGSLGAGGALLLAVGVPLAAGATWLIARRLAARVPAGRRRAHPARSATRSPRPAGRKQ